MPNNRGGSQAVFFHTFQSTAPRGVIGSPQDIRDRIRTFYRQWLERTKYTTGEYTLSADEINIELEEPSREGQQQDGAEEIYNASGFVVRGVYREFEFIREESQTIVDDRIPLAYARCKTSKPRLDHIEQEQNEEWKAMEERQKNPCWRKPYRPYPVALPTLFCHPRIMTLQPTANRQSHACTIMEDWRRNFEKPWVSFLDPEVSNNCRSEWTQLPAVPDQKEEIVKGSPRSPRISIFRLSIVVNGITRKSVLVVFRIVRTATGARPWTKADALEPALRLPPPPPPPPPPPAASIPPLPPRLNPMAIQSLMASPDDLTSKPTPPPSLEPRLDPPPPQFFPIRRVQRFEPYRRPLQIVQPPPMRPHYESSRPGTRYFGSL